MLEWISARNENSEIWVQILIYPITFTYTELLLGMVQIHVFSHSYRLSPIALIGNKSNAERKGNRLPESPQPR